ncbi:MAG: hypothetical protein QOG89_3034 [Thermomicrobiales bacterium]|nr:hypothetical protein [Thermomicrobiales bacterium]MEA2531390.1 hypothetical protein [Thermomicrobiales bacterium]
MASESGSPTSPQTTATASVPQGPIVPVNRAAHAPGVAMEIVRQPTYGQGIVVSLVVAAALLVLAIMAIRDAENTGLPLTETTGPLFWGLAVLIAIGAAIGAEFSEVTAARAAESLGQPRKPSTIPSAWAVPLVATIAAVLLVATHHNTVMLVAGPAIAFFGVAGALLSRDLLDDATEASTRTAATIHTFVIHVVAFLALSGVYLNKMSSWVSAPLVGIISGILILETLERGQATRHQRIFYAILGGAVMAEATIALNWWPTYGWTGGAVLLVCFYVVAGVLLARTQRGSLRSRDLVEYGAVGGAALLILALTA